MATYETSKIVLPNGDICHLKDAEARETISNAKACATVGPSAIASFSDAYAADALDITIAIEPVQSGSGDPSPTNVRPISGWTGAKVMRTGKNLFDRNSAIDGLWTSDGSFDPDRTSYLTVYCKVKPNTTYILSGNSSWDSPRLCYFNSENPSTFTSRYTTQESPLVFTTDEDTVLISFSSFKTSYGDDSAVQLELGSTATAYEPYSGVTIPISWQSVAGTVYGGTLDVTTGLLTVTMAEVDLGTMNWRTSSNRARLALPDATTPPPENQKPINLMFSAMKVVKATTNLSQYGEIAYISENSQTLIAYYDGILPAGQLVYELATPQTYQLTPTQIALLAGENNVWADTGDVTAEYLKADSLSVSRAIRASIDGIPDATQSRNGLISSTDKAKLDGIAAGAQVNTVTGVKGVAESDYRDGNVSLDAEDVGALAPSDVIDDLAHTDTNKPLSANQGKLLNEAIEKREVLIKDLSIQASNLPQTFTNQTGVETDMVCIKAELGTPSAQTSEWEVNTNVAGQIVISGSKATNTATTLKLYLMKSR